MLRIEKNPEIIDQLKNHFVEDGDYTREIMSDEFKNLMENFPDNICVIVSYENTITGFLIAYRPYNRKHIVLDQAGNFSAMNGTAQKAVDLLIIWAKLLGAPEIRFETERNSVVQRAVKDYGFKEIGVSMRMELK